MSLDDARAVLTAMNRSREIRANMVTEFHKSLADIDRHISEGQTHEAVARIIVSRETGDNVIEVQFARAR